MVSASLAQKLNLIYMGGFGVTLILAPSIYGAEGSPMVYWPGNAIASSTATDWFARMFGAMMIGLCAAENESPKASSTKIAYAISLPIVLMGIFNAEADSTIFSAQAAAHTAMLAINFF